MSRRKINSEVKSKHSIKQLNKILGPGVLFASTAIGVSHLVQSTTAGALYGFSMVGFIIAANVFKFPFFEYGSRYAAATGKTLIHGYRELHKFWLYAYMAVTLVSTFFVTATVGIVTIGFMENLFYLNELTGFQYTTHFLLFGGCLLLLIAGGFNVLENLIKILGIVLVLSTCVAFVAALLQGPQTQESLFPSIGDAGWMFLIPLMGWMPTAVDLSTWNSMWTIEKVKQSGYRPTVKETVKEFSFGYWISAFLAILFVTMGAMLVFGSEKEVPTNGVEFSGFVIELYTTSIGKWSFYFISAAAFSIMISTFITVLDGYSRAVRTSIDVAFNYKTSNKTSLVIISLIAIGSLGLVFLFQALGDFGLLVNTATTLSFLIAPLIAALNFRLVMPDKIGKDNSPNRLMKAISYLGLVFLFAFSIWFVTTL